MSTSTSIPSLSSDGWANAALRQEGSTFHLHNSEGGEIEWNLHFPVKGEWVTITSEEVKASELSDAIEEAFKSAGWVPAWALLRGGYELVPYVTS